MKQEKRSWWRKNKNDSHQKRWFEGLLNDEFKRNYKKSYDI